MQVLCRLANELKMKHTIILLILLFNFLACNAQEVFNPSTYEQKLRLSAMETTEKIVVDGKLDEKIWGQSQIAKNFLQSRPDQGKPASLETEVRIVFDKDNIYISAICHEPLGKSGMNTQDLRRDFSYSQNELFSVTFDPFQDVRNPIPTFQIGPYGNQRDLLIFDDRVFDTDWDAVWNAKCTINEDSWVAEMAIPWSSLRYPANSKEWGINFNRNIRRLNEHTGWSLWPRAYTVGRMQYAGLLENINPPDPKLNLRVQPYLLVDRVKSEGENPVNETFKSKIGGEVKWAITPSTVVDLTINTDFAQADVDRQVVNLTRSSIFFPERRQFFLENASLFSTGENGVVQPFFSRTIGLSPTGKPLTIHVGARVIHQDAQKSYGGLFITQAGEDTVRNTEFVMARYLKNVGTKFRIGGMLNYRNDHFTNEQTRRNIVGTGDFFYRFSQPLNARGMLSVSNDVMVGTGVSFLTGLEFTKNWISIKWLETLVAKDYLPSAGFIARKNFILTNPSVDFFIQKSWLPKKVWNIGPSMAATIYHQADNQKLQEADILITPLKVVFRNLSSFGFRINPIWQELITSFTPLPGISFDRGSYHYLRYEFFGETNLSAKYSLQYKVATGGYFNGRLDNLTVTGRVAPIPHLALSVTYTANLFVDKDNSKKEATTHLIAPEIRLALDPLVQFSTFYQYNTATNKAALNARFSWQYRPLSFIYVVYNTNGDIERAADGFLNRDQSEIIKASYIKQF